MNPSRVVWLFPGQGSQAVGMGRDVYASSPAARRAFERADAALGMELSRVIFEGPEEELTRTANAQPALVTVSAALLAALREACPELRPPAFVAGHSLGEFMALVAAGALDLEDAVRIVRARGEAMQDAVPEGEGGMVAVLGLEADVVRSICERAAEGGVLSMANHNAPGQFVLSGHTAAVERACDLVDEEGGHPVVLKVSAPFHCHLMRPAEEAVRRALSAVAVRVPTCPILMNVDAEPQTEPEAIRERLVRQVTAPVLWDATVRRLAAEGATHAIEIGPGEVLSRLGRKIAPTMTFVSLNGAGPVAEATSAPYLR